MRASIFGSILAGLLIAGPALAADDPPADPPEPKLTLRVEPSATGPWKMVVTNEDEHAVRFLADARLLWFEVVPGFEPPDPDAPPPDPKAKPKKAPKPKAFVHGKMPTCHVPAVMRPAGETEARAVALAPKDRYVERFDPALLCGAATERELDPGAVIYPHLGFPVPAPKKLPKGKKPPPPKPPFLIESRTDPIDVMPLKELTADPIVLHSDAVASATNDGAPPPEKGELPPDARDARLTIKATERSDAATGRESTSTLTVKNVGKRPATMHLRPDDFAFDVTNVEGNVTHCGPGAAKRGAPKDNYVVLRAGKSVTHTIIVGELCPGRTFDRPGVYHLAPRLFLRDDGADVGLDAITGTMSAAPVSVRVQTGKLPYHLEPPRVIHEGEPEDPDESRLPTMAPPAAGPKPQLPTDDDHSDDDDVPDKPVAPSTRER